MLISHAWVSCVFLVDVFPAPQVEGRCVVVLATHAVEEDAVGAFGNVQSAVVVSDCHLGHGSGYVKFGS